MEDLGIQRRVVRAIQMLKNERRTLNFVYVHERTTAQRLSVHLDFLFRGWDVDCEYNIMGPRQTKTLDNILACDSQRQIGNIFPDIIIHHRNSLSGPNLLVIELKKDAGEDECDTMKLELMTSPDGAFKYQAGLYVDINGGEFDLTWYKNGDVCGANLVTA